MDVAGVHLGMPLAAAEAALAGTYRCRRETGYTTFEQQVQVEVEKRRGTASAFGPEGRGVGDLFCKGQSGEDLRVTMAQTSAGTVVDSMNMTIPTDRVDPAAIVRQVEGKYGRPTTGTVANGAWCTGRCEPLTTMNAGPWIGTQSLGTIFQILAGRGEAARKADEAAIKAAADLAAPPRTRGAF